MCYTEKKCGVQGCERTHHARGLCMVHLEQQNLQMESLGVPRENENRCATNGCGKPRKVGRFCNRCRTNQLKAKYALVACSHEGCNSPRSTSRYCAVHAKALTAIRKEYLSLFSLVMPVREYPFRPHMPEKYDNILSYEKEIQRLKAKA